MITSYTNTASLSGWTAASGTYHFPATTYTSPYTPVCYYTVRLTNDYYHSIETFMSSSDAMQRAWELSKMYEENTYIVSDDNNDSMMGFFKGGSTLPFGAGRKWLVAHHPECA